MTENDDILEKAKALFAPELKEFKSSFIALVDSGDRIPNAEHVSAAHRIKGGAGFLGFEELRELADKVEKIFKKREGLDEKEVEIVGKLINLCEETGRAILARGSD